MPRRTKPKKRPWYAPREQATQAKKIFAFALKYGWEIRPTHLGIWVLARGDVRISLTFGEDQETLKMAVLWLPDRDDREFKSLRSLILFLAKVGEYGGR